MCRRAAGQSPVHGSIDPSKAGPWSSEKFPDKSLASNPSAFAERVIERPERRVRGRRWRTADGDARALAMDLASDVLFEGHRGEKEAHGCADGRTADGGGGWNCDCALGRSRRVAARSRSLSAARPSFVALSILQHSTPPASANRASTTGLPGHRQLPQRSCRVHGTGKPRKRLWLIAHGGPPGSRVGRVILGARVGEVNTQCSRGKWAGYCDDRRAAGDGRGEPLVVTCRNGRKSAMAQSRTSQLTGFGGGSRIQVARNSSRPRSLWQNAMLTALYSLQSLLIQPRCPKALLAPLTSSQSCPCDPACG